MEQVSITSAYMWAFVIMVAFFLIAVIISNLIPYTPEDPGTVKRRICFWSLGIGTVLVGFIINFMIGKDINVPSTQTSYITHSGYAAGICFVIYILAGFLVSKIFPKSKLGTWF